MHCQSLTVDKYGFLCQFCFTSSLHNVFAVIFKHSFGGIPKMSPRKDLSRNRHFKKYIYRSINNIDFRSSFFFNVQSVEGCADTNIA